MYKLYNGDCLEIMKDIPDKSIDMILCDLPFNITQCKWDILIPFDRLWKEYERIIKDNGAIVLFGKQPFTTDLINSNKKLFRYELIWEKSIPPNFALANKQPMCYHENILVFYKKQPIYNKQMIPRSEGGKARTKYKMWDKRTDSEHYYMERNITEYDCEIKNPSSIIKIPNEARSKCIHPTQKPLKLCEWLIKTYTNDGETVLDNTMGSGSTIIAAINTNRRSIGIELDEKYFNMAKDRIENIYKELNQ